ncbi:MAG: hypothetical protein QM758_15870 [Armatimonas sp.]
MKSELRFLLVAVFAALLTSCGGGGGDSSSLSGVLNVTDFSLPAGQTRSVTGDLIINATGAINIAGDLVLSPGVNVSLYANGPITVTGGFEPAPDRSRSKAISRDTPETPQHFIMWGDDIRIDKNVFLRTTLEKNMSFYLANRTGEHSVTIAADLLAGAGDDGTDAAKDGKPGGGIYIGTDEAFAAIRKDKNDPGAHVFMPQKVVISGKVTAGAGGKGMKDEIGIGQGVAGSTVVFNGGNGGAGGTISVRSSANITLTGSALQGGNGGEGGDSGIARSVGHNAKTNGTGRGAQGQSEHIASGNGGDAGSVLLVANSILNNGGQPGASGTPGYAGLPGSILSTPGNGGPGGKGGNTEILVGNPGKAGQGADKPANLSGLKLALVSLGVSGYGSGNGGASDSSSSTGGAGGDVVMTFRDGTPLNEIPYYGTSFKPLITIENSCNGGKGYDGCTTSPATMGTNGGAGSKLTLKGSTLEIIVITSDNGGDAGAGAPPGMHGAAGTNDAGNVIGTDGGDASSCSGSSSYTIYPAPAGAKLIDAYGEIAATAGIYIPTTPHKIDFEKAVETSLETPYGINSHGNVVGAWSQGGGVWKADLDHDPILAKLTLTPNFLPMGINNSGIMAGGNHLHAATWNNGTITLLDGSLSTDGYNGSSGFGINNSGQVAVSSNVRGITTWYLTQPGAPVDPTADKLTPLPGGFFTDGQIDPGHINDAGKVALASTMGSGGIHAVMCVNRVAQDLGSLGGDSFGGDINNYDEEVGYSYLSGNTGMTHAFLYKGGTMTDLNDFVAAGSGWVLNSATGINDYGEIVGSGTYNGAISYFLLIPSTGRSVGTKRASAQTNSPHSVVRREYRGPSTAG